MCVLVFRQAIDEIDKPILKATDIESVDNMYNKGTPFSLEHVYRTVAIFHNAKSLSDRLLDIRLFMRVLSRAQLSWIGRAPGRMRASVANQRRKC